LRIVDVESAQVIRSYQLPSEVALPSTYLNDLALDTGNARAYLIDAGGEEPHALIVVNLHTGEAHRLFHDHRTFRTATSPAGQITAAGQPLVIPDDQNGPQPVAVGATGITLGNNGRTLYWNRSDELFSIAIADLDEQLTGSSLDRAITAWPVRAFASDGLDQDADGNLVLTDIADSGVQRLDPATGIYTTIATSPELSWPDGVAGAPDGTIYVTSSQLHRGPMFNATDQRRPPFGVFHLTPHT